MTALTASGGIKSKHFFRGLFSRDNKLIYLVSSRKGTFFSRSSIIIITTYSLMFIESVVMM